MPRIWLCVIVRAGRALVMIMAKMRRPLQRAEKYDQVPGYACSQRPAPPPIPSSASQM
jgi:hypothetical protein